MKQIFPSLILAALTTFSQNGFGQSITPQTYGTAGISEVVHNFTYATDGGFLLTGADFSTDTNGNSWVICTDATGKQRWQWTYGGAALDGGNAIIGLPDGGALMVGHSESYGRDCDGIAARFDASGKLLWHNAYGEGEDDAFYDVQQTADGGFICIGLTENYGAHGEDVWLVKLDPNGNQDWVKHFGGLWDDFANKIIPAADGGFWLAGVTFSMSNNQRKEISLLKIDQNGDLIHTWAYHLFDETVAYTAATDPVGNVIIAGNARQENGNFDAVVAQINPETGTLNWMQTYGGPAHDEIRGITVIASGDIVLAGYSDNLSTPASGDAFLLMVSNTGEKIWLQKAGGVGIDDARGVFELSDGRFAIAGKTEEAQTGIFNGYLMTLNPDGITLIDQQSQLNPAAPLLAPNPVSAKGQLQIINPVDFSINLRLFDQKGSLVLEEKNVLPGQIPLGHHQLLPGIYVAEIAAGTSGRVVQRIKLIIQ